MRGRILLGRHAMKLRNARTMYLKEKIKNDDKPDDKIIIDTNYLSNEFFRNITKEREIRT